MEAKIQSIEDITVLDDLLKAALEARDAAPLAMAIGNSLHQGAH